MKPRFGLAALGLSMIVGVVPAAGGDLPSFVAYDFYPFGHRVEGEIKGLFPDIMSQIEALSGIRVALEIDSIPRATRSVWRGDRDLILSGATTPQFKDTISLGIVGCNRTVVVTNAKSGISSLDDLEGKTIGFVANGFLFRKFGNKFGIVPVETGTGESMFRMLLRNRVDGIFISDIVFDGFRAEGAPYDGIPDDWRDRIGNVVEAEVIAVHLRMAKSSKFEHLADKLRRAIVTGNRNGAFDKSYRKYGSSSGGDC